MDSNFQSYGLPLFCGKQMGRMERLIGTLSSSLNSAMSLSLTSENNVWREMIRDTKRVTSGFDLQWLCSPNVTLIMNDSLHDENSIKKPC